MYHRRNCMSSWLPTRIKILSITLLLTRDSPPYVPTSKTDSWPLPTKVMQTIYINTKSNQCHQPTAVNLVNHHIP
jgi:hypothetical protein